MSAVGRLSRWVNLVPRARVPFGQQQGLSTDQNNRGLWERDWAWDIEVLCKQHLAHAQYTIAVQIAAQCLCACATHFGTFLCRSLQNNLK